MAAHAAQPLNPAHRRLPACPSQCIWPPIATLLPRVETDLGWKVVWVPFANPHERVPRLERRASGTEAGGEPAQQSGLLSWRNWSLNLSAVLPGRRHGAQKSADLAATQSSGEGMLSGHLSGDVMRPGQSGAVVMTGRLPPTIAENEAAEEEEAAAAAAEAEADAAAESGSAAEPAPAPAPAARAAVASPFAPVAVASPFAPAASASPFALAASASSPFAAPAPAAVAAPASPAVVSPFAAQAASAPGSPSPPSPAAAGSAEKPLRPRSGDLPPRPAGSRDAPPSKGATLRSVAFGAPPSRVPSIPLNPAGSTAVSPFAAEAQSAAPSSGASPAVVSPFAEMAQVRGRHLLGWRWLALAGWPGAAAPLQTVLSGACALRALPPCPQTPLPAASPAAVSRLASQKATQAPSQRSSGPPSRRRSMQLSERSGGSGGAESGIGRVGRTASLQALDVPGRPPLGRSHSGAFSNIGRVALRRRGGMALREAALLTSMVRLRCAAPRRACLLPCCRT